MLIACLVVRPEHLLQMTYASCGLAREVLRQGVSCLEIVKTLELVTAS